VKSSKESLPRTVGRGIVIDIGTGDGRFVSTAANANPNKFYIGVDANAKALEKLSMKATRKPAKGGLPNTMFVQAAVEDLPDEFDSVADEIHIHFPWGSLLRAVALGDPEILASLRRIAAPGCLLEVVIGVDPERDKAELARLGIADFATPYIQSMLIGRYETCGFKLKESGMLAPEEWSGLETSWARKLHGRTSRSVYFLIFEASE
jgi:16S rRNA (adenine(1408)-N(1))-methyltransferase